MTKKILVFIFAIGIGLHMTGCTSHGSKDEDALAANDSQFSEEGEGDFAQDAPQDEIAQDDGQLLDLPPQDAGQDVAQGPLDGQQQFDGEELALDDGQALPDDLAGQEQSQELAPPVIAEEPQPISDEPVFQAEAPTPAPIEEPTPVAEAPLESLAASEPMEETVSLEPPPTELAAPAKTYVPVQKIRDAAFERAGANLNRVYIGRSGDTFSAVSEKVYGSSQRQKDLKKWNPSLKGKIKTGDKVYYQSEKNPDDMTMLTFYEENGIQPNIYVSKDGDNIRRVSKDLLGDESSWKEVWATNPNVDSKGDISSGIELRYWSDEAVAQAPAVVEAPSEQIAAAPPAEMPTELPPPPEDPLATAPQDPTSIASNDMVPPPPPPPPPPPVDQGTVGGIAPPVEQAPPPPPPPPMDPKPIAKKPSFNEDASANDPDTMMAMGVGGILLLAAAVLFVILKRNRAKRVDLSQTQV